jgi:hypothetical protein
LVFLEDEHKWGNKEGVNCQRIDKETPKLRQSILLPDDIPSPNSLLLIVDIFKVNISVLLAFPVTMVVVMPFVSRLLHTDEMIDEPRFDPKSFDPVLPLWHRHIFPRDINLVLHLHAAAYPLKEDIF